MGFRILLRHLVVVLMQPRPAHARHATEEGVMLIACPGAWHSISSILDRFSGRELREGVKTVKTGERWRGWYIERLGGRYCAFWHIHLTAVATTCLADDYPRSLLEFERRFGTEEDLDRHDERRWSNGPATQRVRLCAGTAASPPEAERA